MELSRRPRILFVITLASCGGAQSHVLELLRATVSNLDVGLAAGRDGLLADAARNLNVPVYVVPDLVVPFRPHRDSRALLSLIRVVRQFRPDLVHAHSSKAGLLARIAARMCGVASVFTAHGWAFTEGTPWIRRHVAFCCERLVLPCADRIITVSEHDRDLARKFGLVPKNGLHCIHNGIADDFRRASPSVAGIPIITMVARFCAQKDHMTLVRALARVSRKFRLQLIGDGPESQNVREQVRRAGLAHCTEFLGERDNIPALLAQSHIFALTSRYEGLPISIMEAMRAGLPVIASDVGGVGELVRDGCNGFLAGRDDVDAVRKCCDALLASPDLRARMGAAGRRRYEEQFTAELMVQKTIDVYGSVIDTMLREPTDRVVPALDHHVYPSA